MIYILKVNFKNMKGLHMVTWTLLIVGGLNWGLEVFNWGIGNYVPAGLATAVYALVGVSALVELFTHSKSCCMCGSCTCNSKGPQQM